MSPPVGPTGLPRSCDGSDDGAPWRVGVSGGAFFTEIVFPDQEVKMREVSVLASLGWHPTLRWGLGLAVGAIADGTLTTEDETEHDVRPGVAASVSATWLAVTEAAVRPFLQLGVSVAASHAQTRGGAGLSAGDLRASVLLGKTFFEALAPYVVARGFGGPVSWDRIDEPGGDANHYAVGGGATLRLPADLDLFVEGVPIGERSLTGGADVAF